jgi:glycosyltransferase involved in cell wall biosynthesis
MQFDLAVNIDDSQAIEPTPIHRVQTVEFTSQIKLSVIIASYNSQKTITKCLKSLERQITNQNFEIIVVDSSEDGTAELISQQFPFVKLYTFTQRKYPGDARNFGVSQSTGEILVFTDSDCIVDSDWVERIITAHQDYHHPVIGGAIDNGNPESYTGWAYYFASLSQWMPQTEAFERFDIPTGFLSVKRWAFEQYGPFLEGKLCEDTMFNWKLEQAGYTSLFLPSMKVAHINIEDLRFMLKRKIKHGKDFAELRTSEYNFSLLRRGFYLCICFILPFVLLFRRAKDVINCGIYQKEFLIVLPLVFLNLLTWSYGEFLGYSTIKSHDY